MISDFYMPLYAGKQDKTVIYDSNNSPIAVTTSAQMAKFIVEAMNDQKKQIEEIESLKATINEFQERIGG